MNQKNIRLLAYTVFTLLVVTAPLYLNRYWIEVLNNIGLYAILALSLNVIVGYAGMFHMGHAAFYAIGAYTTAIISTRYGVPVLWIMPLSALLAGLFAVVVARPIIHLRGDYLLIVTIGLVEIVRIALINNVFGLTGGANGIFGIPRPIIMGFKLFRPHHFLYFIWGCVLLGAVLVIGLPEFFRGFENYRMLLFGLAMILMMIFRTQGILPLRPRIYPVSDEAPEEAPEVGKEVA